MGRSLTAKALSLALQVYGCRLCRGTIDVQGTFAMIVASSTAMRLSQRPLATSSRTPRSLSPLVLRSSSTPVLISAKASLLEDSKCLAASRLGADPSRNRFHQPIVHHERYSFDGWPESHTFPVGTPWRLACAVVSNPL
jgi:hypothetical protein